MTREHPSFGVELIIIGGVLVTLVVAGAVYHIKTSQVNPDVIKQRIAEQVKEINRKYRPDQVIQIDGALEAILNEHEPVKKYVAQIYAHIEKEHMRVHQIAADLKKANKDVMPFLTRYAQLQAKPDELRLNAHELFDECKSLKDSYGLTVHGDKLGEILDELIKILEERGPSWSEKIVGLQSEVRATAKKGQFAQALAKINGFAETFKQKEELELNMILNEQRDFLKRESITFVNREINQAKKDLDSEGAAKSEIRKKLEGFKQGLEGFKEALQLLDGFVVETLK